MNQKEKQITDVELLNVSGMGTIMLNYNTRDTLILGAFFYYKYWFIITQDVESPDFYRVTEASTGTMLGEECYDTIEYCFQRTKTLIESKKYFFATAIGSVLIKTKTNLLQRNLGAVSPAVETLLW